MPFHPAIEEPSNAWPSSNFSGPKARTGTETCCSLPRVSVNRRSTNFTSLSLSNLKTSAAAIFFSWFGGGLRGKSSESHVQQEVCRPKLPEKSLIHKLLTELPRRLSHQ